VPYLLVPLRLLHLFCSNLTPAANSKPLQERFQPYFTDAGYDSWAVSLRSQGGSDRQQGVKVAGTLDSHAADLAEVVQQLGTAPVMVPHSFGGLIAQK
jgi:pimeloyl-ACP methyl ester carboxylesterase